MTAGLPGLRTVPSPLAPRLQAGADLHVHTTHSDGLCSPCEVVIAAAGAGLAALAITDHDTVSALAIARPEAARLGLELVAGAELTCELNGREVHLLGHFLGDDDPSLLAALGWLRGSRTAAASHGREAAGPWPGSRPGCAAAIVSPRCAGPPSCRPYLARTGQVASVREVFASFLGDGCPACVPKPRLDVFKAIGLIRGAGASRGSHTRRTICGRKPSVNSLPRALVPSRWLGRESATAWAAGFAWADEFHLVPIAGSDFHAPDRPGRWVGSITTPPADLERLRRARPANPSSDSLAESLKS